MFVDTRRSVAFFWYVERVDSQLWLGQIGRDMMDLFLDMDVTLMVMLNTR